MGRARPHKAIPGPALLQAWQRSIGALSLLDRAEIAEAMEQPEQARRCYARLLAQYDLPVPALRPRIARAEGRRDATSQVKVSSDHRLNLYWEGLPRVT